MKEEVFKYQERIQQLEKENSILREKLVSKNCHPINSEIILNSNFGVIVYGTDLRYKEWNSFMEKLTGISSKEVLGKHPKDLFPFLVENKLIEKLENLLISGKSFSAEFPFEIKNKKGWVNEFSSVFKGENGEIKGIITIVTNITEHKKIEENLLFTRKKAEENSKRFYSIINNAQAGYFFIDNEGLFQDVNQAWLDLYKYDKLDEVIGKHFTKVQQIEDIDSAIEFVNGIREGNPNFMTGDFSRKCKDGLIGYHSFSARPVIIDGEIVGIEGFLIDITKQKSFENELKKEKENAEKNEELLRLINNASFDQIYSYDLENRFVMANKTLCENLKMKAEDIIGKTYRELGFPEEICSVWDEWHRVAYKKGKNVQIASTPMPDGTTQYFEVNLFVVKDNSGRVIGLSGVNRNITERKNYEQEIIKAKERVEVSEERFKLAMKATKDGLYDWNLITNEIYYSPGWKSMIGYNDDELPNDFSIWEKLTEPEDVQRSWAMQQKVIRKELDRFEMEFKMKHKNGHWIDILSRAEAVFNEEGVAIRIVGTHVDISERKRAEEKIKTAEEKLKKTFNLSPSIIAKANLKTGYFLEANLAVERILGYSIEEFISTPIIKMIHPDDSVQTINEISEQLVGKEVTFFENRYLCKDGTYKWIAWHGTKADEYGIVTAIGSDINERKFAELELIKAKEKAEESERLKTAFLQNMSHEIRTPLNAICGFSNRLKKPNLDEDKKNSFITIINNSTNRLLSIVSDILTVSTIETNQEKTDIQRVNINSIIIELLAIFKVQSVNQNVSIYSRQQLNDRQAEIYTDETKLSQVLSNLLSNALKFTHNGSIEFGYQLVDDKIKFFVKDTGIGISDELHEKIFERFIQADMSITKRFGGTGLGLSICKGFVELLGGEIWVESEVDKGATFYFTIPYKPVNEDCDSKSITEKKNRGIILIAEDEEYNFLFIEELLNDFEYTVIHAKDGQEAIDLYNSHGKKIDLILMDIKMPLINGYEAAKVIKESNPLQPIVAQSAYALEHEVAKYQGVFDDYLIKPIDEKQLELTISKYVREDEKIK